MRKRLHYPWAQFRVRDDDEYSELQREELVDFLQVMSARLREEPAEAWEKLERLFAKLNISDEQATTKIREVLIGRLH